MREFTKPPVAELKKVLTPEQFKVTQHDGTEAPFKNEYWDNHKPGIYVDVVTGEPLFSSLDKYDSGTGWPSFTKPLESENMKYQTDRKLLYSRTEVRSKHGDSHLGHVFDDGPGPDGKRFCMNSASLKFVPAEKLVEEGYGEYASLFGISAPANGTDRAATAKPTEETAILAGGCFWGMEELLRKLPGVIRIDAGYTGGTVENPTYEIVSSRKSGHAESVRVVFDPAKLSYGDLLRYYFRIHDPTTMNQQGNDRGSEYRSAIFYTSPEQKQVAEQVKAEVNSSGKWKNPVVTEITPASTFYLAEEYHQDYLQKNPGGYTCHFLRE